MSPRDSVRLSLYPSYLLQAAKSQSHSPVAQEPVTVQSPREPESQSSRQRGQSHIPVAKSEDKEDYHLQFNSTLFEVLALKPSLPTEAIGADTLLDRQRHKSIRKPSIGRGKSQVNTEALKHARPFLRTSYALEKQGTNQYANASRQNTGRQESQCNRASAIEPVQYEPVCEQYSQGTLRVDS